jgi:heme/copper-type cytochrome/quinol oxidase subunit 2
VKKDLKDIYGEIKKDSVIKEINYNSNYEIYYFPLDMKIVNKIHFLLKPTNFNLILPIILADLNPFRSEELNNFYQSITNTNVFLGVKFFLAYTHFERKFKFSDYDSFIKNLIEITNLLKIYIGERITQIETIYDREFYNLYYNSDTKIIIDSIMLTDEKLLLGYQRLLASDQAIIFPKNSFIRVLVTSNDVIHSWALPSHGIKMDAVPGRINQVQFYSIFLGTNWGQCSELCGINHAFMPIEMCSLDRQDYLHFLLINLKFKINPTWNKIINEEKQLVINV